MIIIQLFLALISFVFGIIGIMVNLFVVAIQALLLAVTVGFILLVKSLFVSFF